MRTIRVPSHSMRPTLELGQHVWIDPEAYSEREPVVGDIVVFHPPLDWSSGGDESLCSRPRATPSPDHFIKRVVAGPGDALSIRGGRVVLNGAIETREGILPSEGWPYCDFAEEIVVPAATWYVVGDNRGPSRDSRHFGPIPTEWIAGKVLLPVVEEQP